MKIIMKLGLPVIIAALTFLNSCNLLKECGECFTPPSYFLFEMVDAETRENIFTSAQADISDLKIKDAESNEDFDFNFILENGINLIEINKIGWQTEVVTLNFFLEEKMLFTFTVDAERLTENCCTYTYYNEIAIEGTQFTHNTANNIYVIEIANN